VNADDGRDDGHHAEQHHEEVRSDHAPGLTRSTSRKASSLGAQVLPGPSSSRRVTPTAKIRLSTHAPMKLIT
jgi:hypothetical protein